MEFASALFCFFFIVLSQSKVNDCVSKGAVEEVDAEAKQCCNCASTHSFKIGVKSMLSIYVHADSAASVPKTRQLPEDIPPSRSAP